MQTRYDYLLVGGGVACVWAAIGIRETDKSGSIAIVGSDPHPPYDRPPLSKDYIAKDEIAVDDAYSKFDDFYPKNEIDLIKRIEVKSIDRAAKSVKLATGETVEYGKLLLATGSTPVKLDAPGATRPNVHYLRSLDDSLSLREAVAKCERMAIVGAGYIGIEVASGALSRGKSVTIIEKSGHPWSRFADEKLGAFMRGPYEKAGVTFHLNNGVKSIDGETPAGPATSVTTNSGANVPADLVLVAISVTQNLDLPTAAGLKVDPKNGLEVDEFLTTSDPNVFAAGDIAYFNDIALGKRWHAEHHLNAKWQGQQAGRIMAGVREPYDKVPYFFSDFLDLHMALRGDPQGGRNTTIVGDLAGAEFTELYHDDSGRITMGIAISHEEPKVDKVSDKLEELIRAKANVNGADLNGLT